VAEDAEEEEVVVEEHEARNTTLISNTIFTSGDASERHGFYVATQFIAMSDGLCGRPPRFGLWIRTRLEDDFAMIIGCPTGRNTGFYTTGCPTSRQTQLRL
jgi:hypothetical protein